MATLKKHSYEFLPDGKLKIWIEEKRTKDEDKTATEHALEFTVTVEASVTKEELEKEIATRYKELKAQREKLEELGIGEIFEVK